MTTRSVSWPLVVVVVFWLPLACTETKGVRDGSASGGAIGGGGTQSVGGALGTDASPTGGQGIGGSGSGGTAAGGTAAGGAGKGGAGTGGPGTGGFGLGGLGIGGLGTGGSGTGVSGTGGFGAGGLSDAGPLDPLDASARDAALAGDAVLARDAVLGEDTKPTNADNAPSDASPNDLRTLGAGIACADVRPAEDLPLVVAGVTAGDPTGGSAEEPSDRGWAFLAVEKLAHCPGLLDRQFVDSVFPPLFAGASGSDPQLVIYACRAVGELAQYTDLLTAAQVSQAYELALTWRSSDDVDARGRSIGLASDLLPRLDATEVFDAFAYLFGLFDSWRATYAGTWDEFEREVSRQGTTEAWLQRRSIEVFLESCLYVRDSAQAQAAYPAVSEALAKGQVDLAALPSIAGLSPLLPEPERGQAIDQVIAGLTSEKAWYEKGSGLHIPGNYANDAIVLIVPILTPDETTRALDAIATLASHRDYQQVFGPTVDLLNAHLGETAYSGSIWARIPEGPGH